MISGITFQPKCGGPSLELQDDGHIHVTGLGRITRGWNKNVDQWRNLIREASEKWDVPEAWIAGVMLQESGGKQQALSPVGAVGLMQIMPSTPAQSFGEPISKDELWKPERNIDLGARLLAKLANQYKWNPVSVAASYNAGGVYCYSGKNCPQAGLWNVNENCGYCEQVVRGINAAIEAGYSGTGASEAESEGWIGWKLFAAGALLSVPLLITMYLGAVPVPSFARNLVAHRNPSKATWRDFIRGEWWIDDSGESLFADQDIGEAGHEAIAINAMLDKNVLISGLIEYYEKQSEEESEQYDNESKIAELQEFLDSDDIDASNVYFTEYIPDEVGIAAAGSKEKWNDIKNDVRLAYAKHYGAIQVVGTQFNAYKVTSTTIEAIQSFIEEQADYEAIDDPSTEIGIEQVEPRKYVSVPVSEFLTIKHPRDLWSR